MERRVLRSVPLTAEKFKPYGQLVGPSPDRAEFGEEAAQLNLSAGTPRLYIMHLDSRGLQFSNITHHARVTQCLGAIGGLPWYMAVAKPSIVDPSSATDPTACRSKAGHFYFPPSADAVEVFRIDGPCFIKLHSGTWHAGPLFEEESMDFYNLELSDTNIVDHTTYKFGMVFEIEG